MENKCFLAVEIKSKNYFPINLLDLQISPNRVITKIEELDSYTLKYTEKELKDAIKEANLLTMRDDMSLVVIYNEKSRFRKVDVMTKDLKFNLWEDIKKKYNKIYLNKVVNFLNNKVTEKELQQIKMSSTPEELIKAINALPYFIERKLYFYLYEK